MKLIQTLYFSSSKNPFVDSFGWASPMYYLMGWALSCLQLKRFYSDVEIFANSSAAKLLIDELELPYDKINITHDNFHLPHNNLWALPKIFTYSLQEAPFLHVDGDVVKDHLIEYHEFLLTLIEQLIVKKAIKPV